VIGGLRAYRAPGAVYHDERTAEAIAKLARNEAREEISAAARRHRDDDFYGAKRISVGRGSKRGGASERREYKASSEHAESGNEK
jgi:hypothetical protein